MYALADDDLSYINDFEKTLKNKLLSGFNKDWADWNIHLIGGQMVVSLRLRSLVSGILQEIETAENTKKTNTWYLYCICS